MVYNAVLRQAAGNAIFQFFKQNRNLFPTSIHVLQSAIVKIARKTKVPAGLVLYRGISMDFPKQFYKTDENGCKGYAEWGFMSTTSDRKVAIMYCGVRDGKRSAKVIQIRPSSVDRAACIHEYSQYPGEREYLFVSLSFLQPEGVMMVEATSYGLIHTMDVRVNANGSAATTEVLLGRKREAHLKAFETIVEELKVELESVWTAGKGENVGKERAKRVIECILQDVNGRLEEHRKKEAGEYADSGEFKRLNEQMLDTRRFARAKMDLWLVGGDVDRDLYFGPLRPLRTCHRLLVALRQTAIDKAVDGKAKAESALALCVIRGVVRTSHAETNELGETPLMQAAADDANPNVLRLLLCARADINWATKEGFTAIYRAAQYGNSDCLEVLVAAEGADIDKAIQSGFTPVSVAAQNGHAHCIEVLHAAGADINKVTNAGATPVYIAAENGHADCIKALRALGANTSIPFSGRSPLDTARERGHLACVDELLLDQE